MNNKARTVPFLLILALAGGSLVFPASASRCEEPPLTLLKTMYLPDIVGDFDHFAVDQKRNHLFVSAEVHHSVEMFDLKTGEHLQSIGGVKTPHSLAFDEPKDELMICDGGDSALIIMDPSDFHRIMRVRLIDGSATGIGDSPDAAYYDAKTRLYYIGNGGVSAGLKTSTISVFSAAEGKIIDNIEVPGNNLESMVVDNGRHRLYVNIRDSPKSALSIWKPRSWSTPGPHLALTGTQRWRWILKPGVCSSLAAIQGSSMPSTLTTEKSSRRCRVST